jgi:SulP family sulfate permease
MRNDDALATPSDVRRFNGPPADRLEAWLPFVRTVRGYQPGFARRDFIAGLTTALFAVPQGMAYALIAGFSPSAGIATSVAASILGAAFGSSEFLINGPTNAISVMIAGNAALFATQGDPVGAVILLTLVIGLMQVCAGLMKVGSFVRFVSEPVLTGFTAGAGVYIVINQIPAFLGLERANLPTSLFGWTPPKCALFDLALMVQGLESVHVATFLLAAGTFLTVRGLQRLERHIGRRVPAPFVSVLVITIIAWALGLTEDGSPNRVQVIRDIEPLTRALPSFTLPPHALDPLRAH